MIIDGDNSMWTYDIHVNFGLQIIIIKIIWNHTTILQLNVYSAFSNKFVSEDKTNPAPY